MNFTEEIVQFLQENKLEYTYFPTNNLFCLNDFQLCIQLHFVSRPNPLSNPTDQRLIHLWEDVWFSKKEVCKSRILAMVGKSIRIPARLTKVRRIDKISLDNFLEINHLQVVTNAKFKYGLYLPAQYFRILPIENSPLSETEELLVAVASFSSARKFIRNEQSYRSFELIRFANLLLHTVVGGLDKLLKHFIQEQKPDDIMTYADCDWSQGKSYEKLGFEKIEFTPAQRFLVNKNTYGRSYANQTLDESSDALVAVENTGNIKFLLNLKNAQK